LLQGYPHPACLFALVNLTWARVLGTVKRSGYALLLFSGKHQGLIQVVAEAECVLGPRASGEPPRQKGLVASAIARLPYTQGQLGLGLYAALCHELLQHTTKGALCRLLRPRRHGEQCKRCSASPPHYPKMSVLDEIPPVAPCRAALRCRPTCNRTPPNPRPIARLWSVEAAEVLGIPQRLLEPA
jgi:hypothetical protein